MITKTTNIKNDRIESYLSTTSSSVTKLSQFLIKNRILRTVAPVYAIGRSSCQADIDLD